MIDDITRSKADWIAHKLFDIRPERRTQELTADDIIARATAAEISYYYKQLNSSRDAAFQERRQRLSTIYA